MEAKRRAENEVLEEAQRLRSEAEERAAQALGPGR